MPTIAYSIIAHIPLQLAELKRLNKIEKEIEIHARSTIRIPVTPFTVLLETLPGVHSSGNSSPKHASTAPSSQQLHQNPLLDEKLFIASVSNASSPTTTINDIILESTIIPSADLPGTSTGQVAKELTARVPLLSGDFDDSVPQPRLIPVRHRFEIDGADCDMSWVCLFVCILLLCVAIPLIYVLWTVEHPHHPHDDNSTRLKGLPSHTSSHISEGTANGGKAAARGTDGKDNHHPSLTDQTKRTELKGNKEGGKLKEE